jgi:hypothetical protein
MGRIRQMVLLTVCIFLGVQVFGQVRVGIKGGLSSIDVPPGSLIIFNEQDIEDLELRVQDAKYGFHLGFFMQAQMGHFFIQPEVLFNSNSFDYRLEDLQNLDPVQIRDENYQYLDMPVILGFKAGPVRFGAGPVAHLFLDSTSDLFDFEGYSQSFDRLTLGWQAGLGFDLWKLHLDFRYEGNFTEFGNHLVFHGRRYTFDEKPARLIASIGISF